MTSEVFRQAMERSEYVLVLIVLAMLILHQSNLSSKTDMNMVKKYVVPNSKCIEATLIEFYLILNVFFFLIM